MQFKYVNMVSSLLLVRKTRWNTQNIYLKDILSLKIGIVLNLAIRYTLDKVYNTNYGLYKSLENNII